MMAARASPVLLLIAAVLTVGGRAAPRQLFLDDRGIESSSGTILRMHPAKIDDSAPKILPGGEGGGAWEGGRIIGYNSVVDNGTHVLLYCTCHVLRLFQSTASEPAHPLLLPLPLLPPGCYLLLTDCH